MQGDDGFEQGAPINVGSMYVPKIQKGLVRIQVGQSRPGFLLPHQARELSVTIDGCATVAETDELLVHWLADKLDWTDPQKVATVLEDFRQMRVESLLKRNGPGTLGGSNLLQ